MTKICVKQGECVPGAVRTNEDYTLIFYIIEHSGSTGTHANGRMARALILNSRDPKEIFTVVTYDEHAIFFMWSKAYFEPA